MTSLERVRKLQKQIDKLKRAKKLAEENDTRICNIKNDLEEDVYSSDELFSQES